MSAHPSEPDHLAYIDALRGYAFLLVFLAHTEVVIGYCGDNRFVEHAGQYGVQLFFIISALTLCKSMEVRKEVDRFPVLYFYLRRFFRIAPLFWCAMAFYWSTSEILPNLWLRSCGPPTGVNWEHFALTGLFLHGWHPYTFNSIVPGGWSIAIEMNFYLVFPFLFYYLNTLKRATIAFLLTVSLASFESAALSYFQLYKEIPEKTLLFFISHGPPVQAGVFLLGIMLYHVIAERRFVPKNFYGTLGLFCFCLAGFLSLARAESFYLPVTLFISAALAGITLAFSGGKLSLLVNSFACTLGKISYSCYLVHFLALTLTLRAMGAVLTKQNPVFSAADSFHNALIIVVIAAIALPMTFVLSTITFHAIENPGIALGRAIIQSIDRNFARNKATQHPLGQMDATAANLEEAGLNKLPD